MGRVMIDCPTTGKPIFTGVNLPKAVLDSSTMPDNTVRCPHCEQPHKWNKKDAYIEGEKKK